jgi:hypothetical protein
LIDEGNAMPPSITAARDRRPWELWQLRSLFPRSGMADLEQLQRKRLQVQQCERAGLAGMARGLETLLRPGRRFLAGHAELRSGLLVTMHVGPYQLLPEPFLQAGIDLGILLNPEAHERFRRRAEQYRRLSHLRGRIHWVPIDEASFVRRLVALLRRQVPVLFFLDGNGGLGGLKRTREQGMIYHLPGREIRVRSGIGRLLVRLDVPVHPVVVRWHENGGVLWRKGSSRSFAATDDPCEVTRRLYDWGFGEVMASPEQWTYWEMLKRSAACFSRSRLLEPVPPPVIRRDLRRALAIMLRRAPAVARIDLIAEVEVWPGDLIVDLGGERFFSAEGITSEDLHRLRQGPTLAELMRTRGAAWVEFHVLRLCLLGLARLRGGGWGLGADPAGSLSRAIASGGHAAGVLGTDKT